MTAAVCLQCGILKHGAWTPCHACKYNPAGQGLEQEAKALYLTDHYRTKEQLEEASAAIKEGRDPEVDPVFVERAPADARAAGKTTMVPPMTGCTIALVLALGAMFAIIALIVWLLVR